MPSVSGRQHRLMELVAHNPKAARKLGIPQSVGKDFVAADVGRKFAAGGHVDEKQDRALVKKMVTKAIHEHEDHEHEGKHTSIKLAKGGAMAKVHIGEVHHGKHTHKGHMAHGGVGHLHEHAHNVNAGHNPNDTDMDGMAGGGEVHHKFVPHHEHVEKHHHGKK